MVQGIYSQNMAKHMVLTDLRFRILEFPLKYDTGWWLGHPSEKYESIGMMTFPIYGKIKLMATKPPTRIWSIHSSLARDFTAKRPGEVPGSFSSRLSRCKWATPHHWSIGHPWKIMENSSYGKYQEIPWSFPSEHHGGKTWKKQHQISMWSPWGKDRVEWKSC